MTSRERLICAMKCGTPDRVPVAPFGTSHFGLDTPLGQRLLHETDLIAYVGPGSNAIRGTDPPIRTEDHGSETHIVYQTPRGPLTQIIRRTEITAATVKFPCATPADGEAMLEMDFQPAPVDLSMYLEMEAQVGEEGLTLIDCADAICWIAELFSPEDFCLLWVEAPEMMERMMQVGTDRLAEWLERACAAGGQAWRMVGPEYASVMLGPQAYERLIVGYNPRLHEIVHHHSGLVHTHNHGPMTNLYDLLLRLDTDSLDPLEAWPWGDCDLAEAKQHLGGKVCMLGNLDDMEILGKKPREEVLQVGRERLEVAGPDGFILGGTSSGTYTEYAAENFIALRELSEEVYGVSD